MAKVDFRAMERSELDLELFRSTFERNGSARTLAHLRWQYLDNPTGRLFVDFALSKADPKKVAAIYSVMPVWMRVSGQKVLGTQSLDTLTDVDFRGQGLFVKLAQSVFERCTKENVALVYGFPNGSSAPGFFKKLGWSRLDPVPFLIKPLDASYFLRRLGPLAKFSKYLPPMPLTRGARPTLPRAQEIHPVSSFDAAYDSLWESFAAGIGAAVHRDARYLSWRLHQKPEQRYRTLALSEHGRLLAFVAFDIQEKHGGRVGYVLELLHQPGRVGEAQKLLQEAIAEMAAEGTEVVLAWSLKHSPNHQAYADEGFFPLPERLRPIELHVGARPLAASNEAMLGNRHNWYFSYLDSDTV